MNDSCSLRERVYTKDYLFFKHFSTTYLRLLVAPGILLNTICLFVLSRPRLSTKSTTILFLRYLAIFDALSITLKYIRQEINYQSITNRISIHFLTPAFCQILYIGMNTCISIAMWTIVLMSVDKAVAVSNPLKSSIWITYKRASYLWFFISFILLLLNLSFINLSGVRQANNNQKYCGLQENKDPLVVDILTASILPIAIITITNIVIAVVLHRLPRSSLYCSISENFSRDFTELDSTLNRRPFLWKFNQNQLSYKPASHSMSFQSNTRRTSVQVTRMLLAVTISLILFNLPNTITFLVRKIYDPRVLLYDRLCHEITDNEIRMYKISFYISVLQDILSDLPHIVNFFLYCLAGKKFRQIFLNESQCFRLQDCLQQRKQQYYLASQSTDKHYLNRKSSAHILFNRHQEQLTFSKQNSLK